MSERGTTTDRQLRWLADAYEQSQRLRIETGERIRAVLQGRDETWGAVAHPVSERVRELIAMAESATEAAERKALVKEAAAMADRHLMDIVAGRTEEPVPILGRTYRRHHEAEREAYNEMESVLTAHPAWPWLERVKGIGPTLACKILARLDIHKADTVSAFWAYCGLATVPGELYGCEMCGLRRTWPVGYSVTGKHTKLGGTGNCKGALVKMAGAEDGVRAAQPRAAAGEKSCYDRYAKKVMYLVGCQFEKLGDRGAFAAFYREQLAKVARERPGWAKGRIRFTALRKVEKLFLSLLWEVWRTAEGLPTPAPYVFAEMGHTSRIDPWSMVEVEQQKAA
jgi:hypothetical protein